MDPHSEHLSVLTCSVGTSRKNTGTLPLPALAGAVVLSGNEMSFNVPASGGVASLAREAGACACAGAFAPPGAGATDFKNASSSKAEGSAIGPVLGSVLGSGGRGTA